MTEGAILNHPLLAQRYFFPRGDSPPAPYWLSCRDVRLACAYHEVSADAPTMIHFHGNGEVVADYLDGFPELIGDLGCNCLLVEYRGYGASTGKPLLGEMLEDAPAVIRAFGQPARKIILFGRSVGSLFALKAASHFPDAAGLILESAIADPLERLLLRIDPREIGTSREQLATALQDSLDIPAALQGYQKPVLVLHARHDEMVDPSHAERLAAWCSGPVRLQIFPRGGHNDIMLENAKHYFALIRDFLHTLE